MTARIGFLGPAEGDVDLLERAANFVLAREHVARAVYLGIDGTLDRCVAAWARRLVGDDPSDEGAWRRAAEVAVAGTPEEIDRVVAGERERLRLRALATLPEDAPCALETVGEVVVLITYDAGTLTEVDLSPANLLVIGNATGGPKLEERGTRWVLELGPIGDRGGVAVLDAHDEFGVITVYDANEREVLRGMLTPPRTAKLEIVPE